MRGVSLEVRDARKKLGSVPALDGLSTSFESGFLHGVIGPDGAGKTTLLRHLIGLLHLDSGAIRFLAEGREIPFDELRPFLGYMPQRQSLYADLTVSEHLDFFRDLHRVPAPAYREKRARLLHMTRLEAFQDRRAGHLSGGMYKKLGLMCALLSSPEVLFLDEPTNGVDPISRREFWELLHDLSSETLVVMTTAYMDEAERCGRVHLLDRGRLLASGEPRQLLEREGVPDFDALFRRLSKFGDTILISPSVK